MTTDTMNVQEVTQLLAPWAKNTTQTEDLLWVTIAPENLVDAVKALVASRKMYISAITGRDLGPQAGQIEVLYHFPCCSSSGIVTLRVHTPRENGAVPSICGVIPSVSLYEREIREMLGIEVTGTPDTSRLFLPDEWPNDVFPLRKDAVLQIPSAQA